VARRRRAADPVGDGEPGIHRVAISIADGELVIE
jgi:hypothetical protein